MNKQNNSAWTSYIQQSLAKISLDGGSFVKKYFTWPFFVKFVCSVVAILLIGCLIAKIIQPDFLQQYKFEQILLVLAITILLPTISQMEAFGVKLSVREQVDNLSAWVKASPYYTLGSEIEEIEEDNLLAERYYRKSLEECPSFWPSIFGLASIYHDEEEYDWAIVYYQNVLKMDPDNVYANTNLANIYLAAPKPIYDPGKALEFAEKAIKLLPSLGTAYYYKVWALNDLGRHKDVPIVLEGDKVYEEDFAVKGDKMWLAYELEVAKSHLEKDLTIDCEKILHLSQSEEDATGLIEVMLEEDERKRFSPQAQDAIQEFAKKYKEYVNCWWGESRTPPPHHPRRAKIGVGSRARE